ncbi:MAG: hypothetical protein K6E54_10610, partial [Bacteroidaceae bacterium]|nr:hypothetical protein [Bacteroidaceae bacterium]
KDLTISLKNIFGSFAFDNFKLYYCGNYQGLYELSDDSKIITLYGNWDDMENLPGEVKTVIDDNSSTLGAVYVYKDNVTLGGELNTSDEGWQTDNNILIYTDYESDMVNGTSNIVNKTVETVINDGNEDYVETYTCTNLVITDKKTMYVPQEFTANKASYTRTSSLIDGVAWGTLVMPFDLTALPTNVTSYYSPTKIDDSYTYGKLIVGTNDSKTLSANTPIMYKASGDLAINETNAIVHKTDELKTPDPENDPLSLYGSYVKYYVGQIGCESSVVTNDDGLCAQDCYYIKQNKFLRGNCYFSIAPFRAFIYRGTSNNDEESTDAKLRSSVLMIEISDIPNVIESLSKEDATIIGYSDATGVRRPNLQRGFNVVIYSDGTTRKIFVK